MKIKTEIDYEKFKEILEGIYYCPREVGLRDNCELGCLECWLKAMGIKILK